MTWVKLPDDALEDPQVIDLPAEVVIGYLRALSWSNRWGRDGRIPRGKGDERWTDAGLADATEDGYQLAWLLDLQPTADEMEAWKKRQAERQARHRRHMNGDHSTCDSTRCRVLLSRVTNGVTNGPPVPTRPDPKGRRGGGNGDGARLGPAPAVKEEEAHISCRDFPRHQTRHRLTPQGWICDPCARRDLAQIVREAPSEPMRHRYRKIFDRNYGHLYGREAAA